MATDYTTASKVAGLLGVDSFVSTTTIPSGANVKPYSAEVDMFINWAEAEIDQTTGHAWRSVLVSDEYHDVENMYWDSRKWMRDIPVHLKHRKIRTFTSGTHKIEVWDGSDWVDLALAANGYTEGRGDDYWIDQTNGVIYFVGKRPLYHNQGVRITYAYGDSTIPEDIVKACTMLATIALLENDDYSYLFPEGTDKYPLQAKAQKWQEKVDKILSDRMELLSF